MGFSPGEFVSKGEQYHLEGKAGQRIILWDHLESRVLLDLDLANAIKLRDHLALLIDMAEHDALLLCNR